MSDPIQGVNTSIPVGVATTAQAGASQSSGESPVPAQTNVAAPVDQADVGTTQALLTTIIQMANDAPAIDEAKVNALQQAIAGGSYQVDPMTIAKKLLQLDSGSGSSGGGQ
jgi:flagellar biosynthesis anti-sigma factor FlgM